MVCVLDHLSLNLSELVGVTDRKGVCRKINGPLLRKQER
jgi:hypothetical protein